LLCLFKSVYAKIAKNVLYIEEIFFFTKVAENSFYAPEFPLTQLTLSLTAPCAPPCPTALGLIVPRKKEKKTGFDDIS